MSAAEKMAGSITDHERIRAVHDICGLRKWAVPNPTGASANKAERNAEFVRLHVEERLTLTAIGERFGISRERVRQIVRKHGVAVAVTTAVRSESAGVDFTCPVCEVTTRMGAFRASRRLYCSRDCYSIDRNAAGPATYRHPDGHVWLSAPGRRTMRAERYIAELHIGRPVTHDECVILRDDDVENWSEPDNIAIVTWKQLMAVRDGRAKREDMPPITETHTRQQNAA